MAGRREIRCIGPSFQLADRKAASQRSVNWRLREIGGLGEDKQVILDSTPGLTTKIDFGTSQLRGAFTTGSREFVVYGTTLYEVLSGYTLRTIGAIAGTDPVMMEDGNTQLVIAAGALGYVMNLSTNVLTQITDPDWRGSYDVAELNGTFIFVALDQPDQFYLSAIDDGSNFDALDFSSSDAQPDPIVTVRVMKQEAYFFNAQSTEVWIYDGGADFPLVRYNSTPIDIGIVGRRAVIRAADTLVFVGRTERGTGIVYMMQGHQPVPISSDAVEEALQDPSVDLTNCTMWVQQTITGEYVGINAPGMKTTWVWDANTKQWHEMGEWVNGDWTPFRVSMVVANGSQHHAMAGTKLYLMSDVGNIDGDPIVQERTWPHLISPSYEPVSYRSLEVSCTTGSYPECFMTLEISNDGGYTFGPPLIRALGAVGRKMQRVRWMPLGSATDRVFRLRCTSSIPINLFSAQLDAA